MRKWLRLRLLVVSVAALNFGACHSDSDKVVAITTTVQVEGIRGMETLVSTADGTVVERHFPLTDGRAKIIRRLDGSLEKSSDEYDSTQLKRERSYAEWTADGKSVLSGRVSRVGGERLVRTTLLDSGERQTTYWVNENLYAECRLAADGAAHWMWWQGSPGKASKWFEEVTTGTGTALTRQSLQFFRASPDPSLQVVRSCVVGPYATASDQSQRTRVIFFREDGITPEFRQNWSRSWRTFYGEEASMNGDNGQGGGYEPWRLENVEELDETGTEVVRLLITYMFGTDSVIIQSATDWPGTKQERTRSYVYLLAGKPFEATIETWVENGKENTLRLRCGALSGSGFRDANEPVLNPEPNLEPAHFVRFRGNVRDSTNEQLGQALAGSVTKDDVPELKWHVLDLPKF